MRCVSISLSKGFELLHLSRHLKPYGFEYDYTRNVLGIWEDDLNETIFIFANGCLVLWNVSSTREKKFLNQISPYVTNKSEQPVKDYFIYSIGDKIKIETHPRFPVDIITLQNLDSYETKLAMSFALAQSIKLNSYELAIQQVSQENENLSHEMAKKGHITLSTRAILKKVGEIFIAKNSVNLSRDHLGIPEFLWKHAHLEQYYTLVEKFMDIDQRIAWLNEKLNLLSDLLSILTSHLECRRSNFLEIIIIILIFSEIIITFLH